MNTQVPNKSYWTPLYCIMRIWKWWHIILHVTSKCKLAISNFYIRLIFFFAMFKKYWNWHWYRCWHHHLWYWHLQCQVYYIILVILEISNRCYYVLDASKFDAICLIDHNLADIWNLAIIFSYLLILCPRLVHRTLLDILYNNN